MMRNPKENTVRKLILSKKLKKSLPLMAEQLCTLKNEKIFKSYVFKEGKGSYEVSLKKNDLNEKLL